MRASITLNDQEDNPGQFSYSVNVLIVLYDRDQGSRFTIHYRKSKHHEAFWLKAMRDSLLPMTDLLHVLRLIRPTVVSLQ